MASMFYEPCCEILKQCAPESRTVTEVTKELREHYPQIVWCGTAGPVRAMLMKAAVTKNCPIRQVPGEKPPKFFYEKVVAARPSAPPVEVEASPEEVMDAAFARARATLEEELLEAIRVLQPYPFEILVNRLLEAIGYGRAQNTACGNDGGIDGFLYGDLLGINVVCVQTKHYKKGNNVQRPEIQRFRGALHGRNGVFVTCSDYSPGARADAMLPGTKIVLIDGKQLVNLMIEHNVGVQETQKRYILKQVDKDYFEDLA